MQEFVAWMVATKYKMTTLAAGKYGRGVDSLLGMAAVVEDKVVEDKVQYNPSTHPSTHPPTHLSPRIHSLNASSSSKTQPPIYPKRWARWPFSAITARR